MRLASAAALVIVAASIPAWAQPALDGPVCPDWAASYYVFCSWQLRPNSSQWLPLLAPVRQTVRGTPGADALDAGGEGDIVHGFGGNDALTSLFDRTALAGGYGNDELSTDARATDYTGLAIQFGGPGNDLHRATLRDGPLESGSHEELLLDLGSGDDVVEANVFDDNGGPGDQAGNRDGGVATAQIYGRGGDDVIAAVADTQNGFGNSLALNAVDGGGGDDHITVRAITEFDGDSTIADNRVRGGDGDDVADATAINWANTPIHASNLLLGGRGHDVMHAFMLTDSNSAESPGVNELWGGEGDDELDAVHETDGENFITELKTTLEGEEGNDRLSAESKAWGENVVTSHRLAGGPGDDTLTLSLDLAVFDGDDGNDSQNVLEGGPGRDHLEATVTASFVDECEDEDLPCDFIPRAHNRLSGGAKNDVLVASIGPDVIGASFLRGGSGDDELTVSGGSGNVLDGGMGKDSLFAGDGDDRLRGGIGRDTIHFDVSADQGSDTLVDFDARHDVLSFAGITDTGRRGLADDLDAISTIHDLGPANDVVIDLASGSQIIFAGRGTGRVDSWADLLPPHAEARWKHAKKKDAKGLASEPAAATLASRTARALPPELALLPRDHSSH